MSVSARLQLRPGSTIAVLGRPDDVGLELPDDVRTVADPAGADAVVAFAADSAALASTAAAAIAAAVEDRMAWIAYPKAGKLDTDLNRDALARYAGERGAQPVRQVAIDDTWSAMRFRPS